MAQKCCLLCQHYAQCFQAPIMLKTVTGFAKKGLPHTYNLLTLVAIHNFGLETANALKLDSSEY